jgi:hypothetical protein
MTSQSAARFYTARHGYNAATLSIRRKAFPKSKVSRSFSFYVMTGAPLPSGFRHPSLRGFNPGHVHPFKVKAQMPRSPHFTAMT